MIGIDKLGYIALSNNISHVCKTMVHGYYSHEAHYFDLVLLQAIFWWTDTNNAFSAFYLSS